MSNVMFTASPSIWTGTRGFALPKTQIVFGSGRLRTVAKKQLGALGQAAVQHARNLGVDATGGRRLIRKVGHKR
eukprot:7590949-Prorocentrum_lima.AAC.1